MAGALLISILVFGCGSASSDPVTKKDSPQACPSALPDNYHLVSIHAQEAFPQKIAVRLDGVLKFDECLEQPILTPPTPVVTASRQNTELKVKIRHNSAYKELPKTLDLEILDRADCLTQAKEFYSVKNVALAFQKNYPYGTQCTASVTAKVDLVLRPPAL